MKSSLKNQKGFSLLECMFALIIITIGLGAVLAMVVSAIHLQTFSRNTIEANDFAKAKIEELRNYDPKSAKLNRSGSLTSDVTNYNDSPDPRFKRRWLIEEHPTDAGVPKGTKRITVKLISNRMDVNIPDIEVQVLFPGS